MNVRNCRRCKRLFNYVMGPPICPECKANEEELFQKVKKYLQDNKATNIAKVSEECEVDMALIQQWVRQERLEFAEGSIGMVCEKCGAEIRTGRYCDKCKAEMVNNLNSALPQKKAPDKPKDDKQSPKMRFIQ